MSRRRSVLQEPPFVQQMIRSWIPTTLRCLGWLALMVSLTGALALALFAYLLPLSILAQLLLWAGVVLGACLALMLFALVVLPLLAVAAAIESWVTPDVMRSAMGG